MSAEYEKALWEYIKTLETENKELITALTQCIKLLEQFREHVPDPNGGEDMLELFRDTLEACGKVKLERSVH